MKIIKDNSALIKTPFPTVVICRYCTSEIEIEGKADIKAAAQTKVYIGSIWICPVCAKENPINI